MSITKTKAMAILISRMSISPFLKSRVITSNHYLKQIKDSQRGIQRWLNQMSPHQPIYRESHTIVFPKQTSNRASMMTLTRRSRSQNYSMWKTRTSLQTVLHKTIAINHYCKAHPFARPGTGNKMKAITQIASIVMIFIVHQTSLHQAAVELRTKKLVSYSIGHLCRSKLQRWNSSRMTIVQAMICSLAPRTTSQRIDQEHNQSLESALSIQAACSHMKCQAS